MPAAYDSRPARVKSPQAPQAPIFPRCPKRADGILLRPAVLGFLGKRLRERVDFIGGELACRRLEHVPQMADAFDRAGHADVAERPLRTVRKALITDEFHVDVPFFVLVDQLFDVGKRRLYFRTRGVRFQESQVIEERRGFEGS
jgi:hypothetical protein